MINSLTTSWCSLQLIILSQFIPSLLLLSFCSIHFKNFQINKIIRNQPPITDLTALNIASKASGLLDFWLKHRTTASATTLLPSSASRACGNTTKRISTAYLLKSRLTDFNRIPTDSNTISGLRFSILTADGSTIFWKSSCNICLKSGWKASLRPFAGFSLAFSIALRYISKNVGCEKQRMSKNLWHIKPHNINLKINTNGVSPSSTWSWNNKSLTLHCSNKDDLLEVLEYSNNNQINSELSLYGILASLSSSIYIL